MLDRIEIKSIPSDLPGWFDPKNPNFKKPKDWTGTRVRIEIPISKDPVVELQEARDRLILNYPGADLHLVSNFSAQNTPKHEIENKGSDSDLLRQYFETLTIPSHISIEQIIPYLSRYLPGVNSFGIQGFRFLSVEGINVLGFEVFNWDLTIKGLTLITGRNEDSGGGRSNGAGKTSWVSIPFIGLFGKSFKDQTHDEWHSQDKEDEPSIIKLKIELADKRIMEIHRGRKPGLLRVWVGGKEMTMGKPNQTQDFIESQIDFTWEILTNAVYVGQNEIASVFGTEKERKVLFSRLLGLERFLDVQSVLRKVALKIQKSIEEIESEMHAVDVAKIEAEDSRNFTREKLKGFNQKRLEKEVHKLKASLRTLETESKSHTIQYEKVRERINGDLRDEISKHKETIRVCQNSLIQNENLLKEITQDPEKCYVCGSIVNLSGKSALKTHCDDVVFRIKDSQKKKSLAESKLKPLIQELNELEVELNSLIEEDTFSDKMAELRNRINLCDSQLDRGKTLNELYQKQKSRVFLLKKRYEIHKKARDYTIEEKEFVSLCVDAVSRDGLPAYLCASVAPQLNKTAALFSEYFSEGEIGLQFVISAGEIDVRICNQHGGLNIKDQSKGEMRMAGIISAFTFRDVLLPINLLICDEPSDGLDSVNSIQFAKGLMELLPRFEHIVIISHNSNILGALEPDQRIEIIKKDRVSKAV